MEYDFMYDRQTALGRAADYEYVSQFYCGLAKAKRGGLWGFVDEQGNEVIECKYDFVFDFDNGVARVMLKGFVGMVDTSGISVLDCVYNDFDSIHTNYYGITKNKKWGLIDLQGNFIIPCIYDYICATHRVSVKACLAEAAANDAKDGARASAEFGKQGLLIVRRLIFDFKIGNTVCGANLLGKGHIIMLKKDGLWGLKDLSSGDSLPCIYSRIWVKGGDLYLCGKKFDGSGGMWCSKFAL